MDILYIICFGLSIIFFFFPKQKKYSKLRKEEAIRYFNGSIILDSTNYQERVNTNGIAIIKDDTKISFRKQAKMCDTALLY